MKLAQRQVVLVWLTMAAALLLDNGRASAQMFEERCSIKLSQGYTPTAFSPSGNLVATAEGKVVKVWNLRLTELPMTRPGEKSKETGLELRHILEGHEKPVLSLAFSPDGVTLASGSRDGTVRLWSTDKGQLEQTLAGHGQGVYALAFSRDGKQLGSGSSHGAAYLWEVASGKRLAKLEGHIGEIATLAFSPDGTVLATAGNDTDLRIWNSHSTQPLHVVTDFALAKFALVFLADGKTVVAGGADKTVGFVDVASGKLGQKLTGQEEMVGCLAVSPDNQWLVSGGLNADEGVAPAQVVVWDLKAGKVKQRLPPHRGGNLAVAFSPNGKFLLSASFEGAITVWDVRD